MLKQVSVFMENSMGSFQRVTEILSDLDINIWGSVNNDSAEYGIIRMVVSDPDAACAALTEAGYLCRRTNVLGVEMKDEVGSLNRFLTSMRESNININYMYLSFNRESGMPVMVVHTDELREVEACIRGKGFDLL